jgi:hypothetical protein
MNDPNEETQLLSECIVIATKLAKMVAKKCQDGDYKIDALARVNDALSSLSRCRDFLPGVDDGADLASYHFAPRRTLKHPSSRGAETVDRESY